MPSEKNQCVPPLADKKQKKEAWRGKHINRNNQRGRGEDANISVARELSQIGRSTSENGSGGGGRII